MGKVMPNVGDSFLCPMCGGVKFIRCISRRIGGSVVECAHCGHFTLWPQPGQEEVIRWYINRTSEKSENCRKGAALYDDYEIKLFEKYDPRKNISIIDVGCGVGASLKYYTKKGYHIIGIDIDKEIVNSLKKQGFEIYQKTLEEMSISDEKYDWVICYDVLEHIREPLKAIKILSGLVKQNGLLGLSSPNGEAINAYGEQTYALSVDKEHLNYFRPLQLIAILEKLGFTLVCKKFYPKSVGLGRANMPETSSNQSVISCKNKYDNDARDFVHKFSPHVNGCLRSIVQIVRRCASIDQIINGVSHEFSVIMRKT